MRSKILAVVALIVPAVSFAAVPALDTAAATTYLETNAGGAIVAIGLVMLTLAGLAVAVKWAKATFFG